MCYYCVINDPPRFKATSCSILCDVVPPIVSESDTIIVNTNCRSVTNKTHYVITVSCLGNLCVISLKLHGCFQAEKLHKVALNRGSMKKKHVTTLTALY